MEPKARICEGLCLRELGARAILTRLQMVTDVSICGRNGESKRFGGDHHDRHGR